MMRWHAQHWEPKMLNRSKHLNKFLQAVSTKLLKGTNLKGKNDQARDETKSTCCAAFVEVPTPART
eukprot:307429-Pelagomonas_calceolata.AAC.8